MLFPVSWIGLFNTYHLFCVYRWADGFNFGIRLPRFTVLQLFLDLGSCKYLRMHKLKVRMKMHGLVKIHIKLCRTYW